MSAIDDPILATSGRRRCLECGRSFRPARVTQVYCSERHRRTALMRRKRARESLQQPDRPAPIQCADLLEAAQSERARMGRPPLVVDGFLEARALVLEAEMQVKAWAERLRARRLAAEQLADPGGERAIKRLAPGEALLVPDWARSLAIVSTDGHLGLVVYGTTRASGPA